MTLFYGILLVLTLIVLVGLIVWETWQQSAPDDEEVWVDEEDERRTPNWRRI